MSGLIQPQWDLGKTTSEAALAIRGVIRACSMDDVQYQAVLAFESLGAGLLVNPCRIGDVVDALGGRKNERIAAFRLMIGLSGDGLSRELRSSRGCVSAFALAIACKTCFDDAAVANILYELMTSFGVYKQYPISAYQVSQLLKAISQYGNGLVPIEQFAHLSEQVLTKLDTSDHMPGLLSDLEPKVIADILHKVFRALQDLEIALITLEGSQGGIWLATVFLWLDPDNTEVRLDDEVIAGHPSSRLLIKFSSNYAGSWQCTEWKNQKNILTLIDATNDSPMISQSHSFFPQRCARSVLGERFGCSQIELEAAGQVAGALVQVAISRAAIKLDARAAEEQSILTVELSEVVNAEFLATHHRIVTNFGWEISSEFEEKQSRIVKTISSYLDRFFRRYERILTARSDCLKRLKAAFNDIHRIAGIHLLGPLYLFPDTIFPGMVEIAINIAAEALSLCLYQRHPDTTAPLYMRSGHFQETMRNAVMIWDMIFVSDSVARFPFSELQKRTFDLLLCRSDLSQRGSQELVVADNGRVVFFNPIMNITVSKRDCAAICVLSGTIRTEETDTNFSSVLQNVNPLTNPRMIVDTHSTSLEVFVKDEYQGLGPRRDPIGYEIKHHTAGSGKVLQIMSYLHNEHNKSD